MNGVAPVADEIAPVLLGADRREVQAGPGPPPFRGISLRRLMGAVRT